MTPSLVAAFAAAIDAAFSSAVFFSSASRLSVVGLLSGGGGSRLPTGSLSVLRIHPWEIGMASHGRGRGRDSVIEA